MHGGTSTSAHPPRRGGERSAIVSFIQHRDTKPPLTLGIKGAWGSGKSSVMRMVQAQLDPPCDRGASDWRFPDVVLTSDARRKLELKGEAGRTEGDGCPDMDPTGGVRRNGVCRSGGSGA